MNDRLRVEPLRMDHADLLFEPLKDERIYLYISERPYATVEALRDRYASLLKGPKVPGVERWLNWVMFDKHSESPVGTLQATVLIDQRRAYVAYVVFAEHWQQGYGKEGLAWLVNHLGRLGGIDVLEASIDARNLASIKLIQQANFQLNRVVETSGGTDQVYIKNL